MSATLKSRLPLIAAAIGPRVNAAVRASAEMVAQRAKERVPVGAPTVHLRDAIHVEAQGPLEYAVIAGDDDVFYGHLVELGTSHSSAQPFLIPAMEESTDAAEALVLAALRGL